MSKIKNFIEQIADRLGKDITEVTQQDFDNAIKELDVQ
jgi:hypothetical protein